MRATQEQLGPFTSDAGRAMSAAKQIHAKAMIYGQMQGAAICVQPATFPLGPFATCTIHLSCYAARAGIYEDMLHLQAGSPPPQRHAMAASQSNSDVLVEVLSMSAGYVTCSELRNMQI